MEVIVIGTEPPCPRCRETLHRVKQMVKEHPRDVFVRKIVYTSEEAQRFGKVGTAHDIAEWASISVNWEAVKKLAAGDWTPELDEILMPLKRAAEEGSWIMTPVVAINDIVVYWGSVPTQEELRRLLGE